MASGTRQREILCIDEFLGVDFTNDPANVNLRQSPNAVNMIRQAPGKVRKAMGYAHIGSFGGPINGVYARRGDAVPLVHAGGNLYKGAPDAPVAERQLLWQGMGEGRSHAWQMGDALYIADGVRFLKYDGQRVTAADSDENAYVPLVTIAKYPGGGGEPYEALNLLQPKFRERFCADGTSKRFVLSFEGLDDAPVKVAFLNQNGEFEEQSVAFSVERSTGVITFTVAPPATFAIGVDNVEITAARTVPTHAKRINECDVGVLFGLGGGSDRLFLSGCTDGAYVNRDFYSAPNDPGYFPDLNYSVLGSAASRVMGYSVINDRLATYKDERDQERNVIIRSGSLLDGQAVFSQVGTLQGSGAVSAHCFGYLGSEPLFFTRLGVFAITPQDLTGERYSQNRSFYLDGRLLNEPNPEEAYAFVWRDFYFLCLNGKAYILDGRQPLPPAEGMPYATRQYAAFYRENLPVRVMWELGERLYFGDEAGRVYRFYEDAASGASYTDNGVPIAARWETPEVAGKWFARSKRFGNVAVKLGGAAASGVDMWACERGRWRLLKSDHVSCRHLDFGRLDFGRFSFAGDGTPRPIAARCAMSRADKARFAFENNEPGEPFALFNVAIEYDYKGRHG